MYALIVAMASVGAPADAQVWQTSYATAQQQAIQARKPLVVVFGAGNEGWKKLNRDGDPAGNIADTFATEYVCLYVDTATEAGKKLAQQFQINNLGIVISNRAGDLQAFRHEGDLSRAALDRYLKRFADPDLVVTTTVTNPGDEEHKSFYQGAPAGYCPSCQRR
ncbi:MAG: hypothetical protein AB7K24_04955 [Gemmataceae bacterium]